MTTTTVPAPLCMGIPLPPGVTLEHAMVTPDLAAEFLTHNTHNRTLKPVFEKRYAADMGSGDWTWTGEPIRFDATGRLLDGQNRLHALIDADVTLPFLIIRGLPAEAQDDMDTGAPRKFYDVLKLRGETNATHLAALTRRVAAWDAGYRRNLNSVVVSYHALSRVLEQNPGMREVIAPARKAATGSGLMPSVATLTYWLFSNVDADDAEFFFTQLADGQAMVKGDPIFELRRTLAADDKGAGRGESWQIAITIKAWNAYRNGDTVGLYRWRPGGARPESFPEPA